MLLAALDAPELATTPPAALEAALDAALEAAELVAADVLAAAALVVELLELAAADEVPVHADSRGTAAALAMPAPMTRSIVRRFMPLLRSSPPKSESVTVDLRFKVDDHRPPNANRTSHQLMVKSTHLGCGIITVVTQATGFWRFAA
jgi:hypothetical protein